MMGSTPFTPTIFKTKYTLVSQRVIGTQPKHGFSFPPDFRHKKRKVFMGIRNKSDVIKTIKERVRTRPDGGISTSFEVYFGTNQLGQKIRECRATLKDALQLVDQYYKIHKKQGDVALNVLRPVEIYDAAEALAMLKKAGLDVSLRDVAKAHIESLRSKKCLLCDRTLHDAYAEYLTAVSSKSHAHVQAIHNRVGLWIEETGADRMCSSITPADFKGYLAEKRKASLKTYNNCMTYLKMFFRWCAVKERGYILDNPLDESRAEAIPYREPEYISVDNMRKIISAMSMHKNADFLLTYTALNFFCGVRNDEIARLAESPSDLILEDKTIRISKVKGWTMGRMPRAFAIPDNAMEFLKGHYSKDVLTAYKRPQVFFRLRLNEIAAALNITIPENAGRHSFITYHVAAYGDPGKTEGISGTSRKMRCSHYMGLASKSDGEAYFSLTPSL